jgi:hypothetical protein
MNQLWSVSVRFASAHGGCRFPLGGIVGPP